MMMSIAEAFTQARQHEAQGQGAAARRIYDDILVAIPDHPGALLCIARQLARDGNRGAARTHLVRALASANTMGLPDTELWTELGTLETSANDSGAARTAFERALEGEPSFLPARLGIGDLDIAQGEFAKAEARFRAIVADAPDRAGGWVGLGQSLAGQGRLAEAESAMQRALELAPGNAAAQKAYAWIALRGGDLINAEARYRAALATAPRDTSLLRMLAYILISAGAAAAAEAPLRTAIEVDPDDSGARVALGGVLIELGQLADAKPVLEDAIARGITSAEAYDNLGLVKRALGDDEGAAVAFERAHEANAALTPALANLVFARRYLCDFEQLPAIESRLTATLDDPSADQRFSPFIALSTRLKPAQQRIVARRWSEAMLPPPAAPLPVRSRGTRLRVAYLSGDFHDHATSRLLVGMLERHDKSMIETFGVSYGSEDGSALRKRVMRAFDQWFDARGRPDQHVAMALRDVHIDVVVDLKGHTEGNRLAILGGRGAPRQIHWLGYPGTLGYDAVEGLVADDIVVPTGDESNYHERILRLPRAYLPSDPSRAFGNAPTRESQGLPASGVVLACFNPAYKITREVFGVWLDALERLDGSVLWLLQRSEAMARNVREYARRRGVDPNRIVFGSQGPQDAHLARLQLADIALDTLPYGSHTTGVDALLAGVPLLTCLGDTFAGRVGASLVRSAGVPELTAASLDDYRAALIRLGGARDERETYRERLLRREGPLFDPAGFARDFERLLVGELAGRPSG